MGAHMDHPACICEMCQPPIDEEAVERAVRAIHDLLPYEESLPGPSREIVLTVLRAINDA